MEEIISHILKKTAGGRLWRDTSKKPKRGKKMVEVRIEIETEEKEVKIKSLVHQGLFPQHCSALYAQQKHRIYADGDAIVVFYGPLSWNIRSGGRYNPDQYWIMTEALSLALKNLEETYDNYPIEPFNPQTKETFIWSYSFEQS